MNLVSIVIPVYKIQPSKNEYKSFRQCLKILNKYPIILVCPISLDVNFYINLALKENANIYIERFKDSFFENVISYNNLLLSLSFYNRFKQSEFILIYQLDAWVFRDELEYWCKLDYDYIGAPWFEEFGSNEDGKKLWNVGNGGFSLRKVGRFIYLLSYNGPVYKPHYIRKHISFRNSTNFLRTAIYFICKCFGYENSVKYFIQKNKENEDCFWTLTFQNSWIKLEIAQLDIAIKFAFEKSPSYLFSQNNNKLPFGCHAWEKNEYLSFWKLYIT